ncbi:hypothetical protein B0T11DRAFT_301610 [Plectosphaerella cucumerina]|uniref:Uncharacterized protein n=1 Tax=Plectosphaerella cucumerina TaxID=40658 RepID=A0A8K0T5G0_9PEZI|nr:hypothetical protein B0T11DRAFT_301610 [Plectosphaerella cucumerina]
MSPEVIVGIVAAALAVPSAAAVIWGCLKLNRMGRRRPPISRSRVRRANSNLVAQPVPEMFYLCRISPPPIAEGHSASVFGYSSRHSWGRVCDEECGCFSVDEEML